MMQILSQGFCPFRVEVSDYQAGCVLRMGNESTCYSQDIKPLIQKEGAKNYFCPLLKFDLSQETYLAIERLVEPLLTIQDSENTGINIWPMVKGISQMKHKATTSKGKEIEKMSQEIKSVLDQIVMDLE
ncbi:MAG: hypothetical protein ACXACU_16470 [Candidatus Hodarchaeales archaeon]|jgi:hypothetical protein